VQQTALVAVEEYLSMRETAEILADPASVDRLPSPSPGWRRRSHPVAHKVAGLINV
jgi:hypothetical protein